MVLQQCLNEISGGSKRSPCNTQAEIEPPTHTGVAAQWALPASKPWSNFQLTLTGQNGEAHPRITPAVGTCAEVATGCHTVHSMARPQQSTDRGWVQLHAALNEMKPSQQHANANERGGQQCVFLPSSEARLAKNPRQQPPLLQMLAGVRSGEEQACCNANLKAGGEAGSMHVQVAVAGQPHGSCQGQLWQQQQHQKGLMQHRLVIQDSRPSVAVRLAGVTAAHRVAEGVPERAWRAHVAVAVRLHHMAALKDELPFLVLLRLLGRSLLCSSSSSRDAR